VWEAECYFREALILMGQARGAAGDAGHSVRKRRLADGISSLLKLTGQTPKLLTTPNGRVPYLPRSAGRRRLPALPKYLGRLAWVAEPPFFVQTSNT